MGILKRCIKCMKKTHEQTSILHKCENMDVFQNMYKMHVITVDVKIYMFHKFTLQYLMILWMFQKSHDQPWDLRLSKPRLTHKSNFWWLNQNIEDLGRTILVEQVGGGASRWREFLEKSFSLDVHNIIYYWQGAWSMILGPQPLLSLGVLWKTSANQYNRGLEENVHSLKLTTRPWKMVLGRRSGFVLGPSAYLHSAIRF